MSPPSLALDLNPFRDVWHRQGHLCPPPLSKVGRGTCPPPFRRSSQACYKFRDVWHRPGHLCPSPLSQTMGGVRAPLPIPAFNPFRDVWHRQGHLCPPPLKSWEGHVSPASADPCRHVINSEMSDIGRVTCAPPPFLKLWEGHVLPSPFPLLIHSEMFHRLGHLCPLLKS